MEKLVKNINQGFFSTVYEWGVEHIVFTFPVHLFFIRIKQNHILLLYWIVLFGVISENIGATLGIPTLFLDPEYRGEVNFISFFIMGMAIGLFIMAYHITCYILDNYRYSFLINFRYPFLIFCFNNSVIPLAFIVYYVAQFVWFQKVYEQAQMGSLIAQVAGFMVGLVFMLLLITGYFRMSNRGRLRHLAENVDKKLKKNRIQRQKVMNRLHDVQNHKIFIHFYFHPPFRMKKINHFYPFDRETVLQIFNQTQLNAVIISFVSFVFILLLGLFRDHELIQIPAAASVILLFTILLMLSGALSYWFKGWSVSVAAILLFVLLFYFKWDYKDPYHKAFGMDYSSKALYTNRRVYELANSTHQAEDKQHTLQMLNNWRAKFPPETKPKMILMCFSGGGQRSALWAIRTLQHLDSSLNGQLMQNTFLITGSSGGLFGAAYYRELYLKKQNGEEINLYDPGYLERISRDKLNPTVFSMISADMFFRFHRFDVNGKTYFKDRGYAIEDKWNKDTEYFLDKPLDSYALPEQEAKVPMMLITPTILNDGRKLYIASQPVSYMLRGAQSPGGVKGIEFNRFFEEQGAQNMRLTTALRMNATFPYITPTVVLPSNPAMEVMDSGYLDNYGINDAVRFLNVFKEWLQQNTSGVIVISVRDSVKGRYIAQNPRKSWVQELLSPLNSVWHSLSYLQDLSNDQSIEYAKNWYDGKLYLLEFQYQNGGDEHGKRRAALSWRLSEKEKEDVLNAIYSTHNKKAARELSYLLTHEVE
ncbi:patatin-like phospholipase family protein [Rapidithrix thailandica]|uniref:Patatin-like phospholipase family protein n=1 Tax=Rapidithrix thailandica TaxID=413964 RepID=A0AAW9RY73_9BACT